MSSEPKARMGRPPKPPEERLTGRLISKVTEAEEKAAKRCAEMLRPPGGVFTVSNYVRMLVQQDLAARGMLARTAEEPSDS